MFAVLARSFPATSKDCTVDCMGPPAGVAWRAPPAIHRLVRVLCLHGDGGGKKILEDQLDPLVRAAAGNLELIFLEGPQRCRNDEACAAAPEAYAGEPKMVFAETSLDDHGWKTYKHAKRMQTWFQTRLREHAPIDGILGFCQGANFAVMLAGAAFSGSGAPLSFVCLLSPDAPGYVAQVPDLFEKVPLLVPAFIVRGEQEGYDDLVKKKLGGRVVETGGLVKPSDHITKLFACPVVRTHRDGRRPLPLEAGAADTLAQEIVSFCKEKGSSHRVPRVMCLHSAASSKKILDIELRRLVKLSNGRVEFVVVEGPQPCVTDEPKEIMSRVFEGYPMLEYASMFFDDRGWILFKELQKALDYLQAELKKNAPIDGIIGFSMGANFAVMLAAQASTNKGAPLSFVILHSPNAPGYLSPGQVPELFEDLVTVPALIVHGELEGYTEGLTNTLAHIEIETYGLRYPGDHVAKLFKSVEVNTHKDGHRIFPENASDADSLCNEVILPFIFQNFDL